MEPVSIKSYMHRHEAEMDLGLLKKEGIDSYILADDCGGMYPPLSLGMEGLHLMVREEDVERALGVIEKMGEEESKEEE